MTATAKRWTALIFLCSVLLITALWRSPQRVTAQVSVTPDLVGTRDALNAALTQQAQVVTTALPTSVGTVAPQPTSPLLALTPIIGQTPLPTSVTVRKIGGPPLSLTLPSGWRRGSFARPTGDTLVQSTVDVAVYTGPIQAATAYIFIMWNYPAIALRPTLAPLANAPTPVAAATTAASGIDEPNRQRWLNGLRLLQGTVVDITCNIGHYGIRTDFRVGGLTAIGETFTASQCANEPDTVGWFAGFSQYDQEYLVYVLIEPAAEFNNVTPAVQAILDSMTFVPPEQLTLTPLPPTPAP